jgi:plastocyanin
MRSRTYLVFALLLAPLIGVGAQSFDRNILPTVQNAHASTVSILLNGFTTGWNASTVKNPTITVNQGDTVSLTLKSGDLALHQFLVDGDNDGAEATDCPTTDPCSNTFSTATGITYMFTVNLSVGVYTYYCTIHPTSMLGSFVVNPGSVGAPTIPVDKLALVTPYIVFAGLVIALLGTVIYAARSGHRETKVSRKA